MKKQTQANHLIHPCLALALALVIWSPVQLQSAEPIEGKEMKMDSTMMEKCEEMKKHMMRHMEMGKESMAKCPMMKDMQGMDDSSAGDHKKHQQELQ